MMAGLGVLLCTAMTGFLIYALQASSYPWFGLLALLTLVLAGLNAWMFTRDAFTFTHYPIRFNRRTGNVFVFQRDGSVLKAKWSDIAWVVSSKYESGAAWVKSGCQVM